MTTEIEEQPDSVVARATEVLQGVLDSGYLMRQEGRVAWIMARTLREAGLLQTPEQETT